MRLPRQRKTDYLWFRPASDVIWFSRAVPKHLQKSEGRKVIQFSLGTTDRREAEALARRHASELDERWGLLPPVRRVPTDAELEATAVSIAHDDIVTYEDRRRHALRGTGAHRWQRHVARTQINLDTQAYLTTTGDPAMVREIADIAIEGLGFDIPRDSEQYARFCEYLNAAQLAAMRVSHERSLGNIEAEADSKLVQRVREREKAKAKPGETLMDLFERWAAEQLAKKLKRADTVEQDRKAIQQFAKFVGEDRAIASITPVEAAEYRDALRDLPPKWRANNRLKGLGMREAVAKARQLNLPKSAFNTVNKHLSTISPLYKWLRAQPAWAGLANPCDGLFHTGVRGKNPRPPFTSDQLNKMLKSPLFTGFLADGREHVPGNVQAHDWRRWIPLVCLFTGARIGEIAQLRLRDVRQEHEAWFVHIRHDEGAGLVTKSGRSRPAAVHPILEKVGFLAFHERQLQRANGDINAALFPELEPNKRGQISGEPSRWWRDYLAAIGIKDTTKEGGDGFGAHSFRHTLSDRLRSEAELIDTQVGIVLGHSQPSTTAGYGALPQGTVKMLKGWMEAVRFEGVDFSHLILTE